MRVYCRLGELLKEKEIKLQVLAQRARVDADKLRGVSGTRPPRMCRRPLEGKSPGRALGSLLSPGSHPQAAAGMA
jgi:hypothetical protein